MIKEAISELVENKDLTNEMAEAVMDEIMSGEANDIEIGSYLTALRMKGETINEITASAKGMRKACVRLLHNQDVLEIVGTGGDKAFTFNISTVSGFIIAAAGVPVAKHGNRSVSSKCGAADVLEALGVNIALEPDSNAKVLKDTGMCFMFAQKYHPSMRFVAPARKTLGIRTIFNILGPLSNPAGANMELMGVYSEELLEPLAQVMSNLGVKAGMVVCGSDGLDEITMTGVTKACEIKNGKITSLTINPEDYGFKLCKPEELVGGFPDENASIATAILKNEDESAKKDVVLLNAGVCLYIAGKASTISEGIKLARDTIESGKAYRKMCEFVEATQKGSEVSA